MVAFNAMPLPEEYDALDADGVEALPGGDGVAGRIGPVAEGKGRWGEGDRGGQQLAGASAAGRLGVASDRRVFPRRELSLRVAGRRLDHSVEARREPCLNFSMDDVSVGGLSATSQTRLGVGERVAVFFPPEAGSRGWDAYGRVLRVRDERGGAGGFRVAVEFDQMLAA